MLNFFKSKTFMVICTIVLFAVAAIFYASGKKQDLAQKCKEALVDNPQSIPAECLNFLVEKDRQEVLEAGKESTPTDKDIEVAE